MDLEQFKKSQKPAGKRHALHPHASVIECLLDDNYAHAQIAEYLRTNGIKCSAYSLGYFIRKHLKPSSKPAVLDQQSKSLAIKPSIDSPPPQKSVNNQEQIADKAFSQINLEEFL
jgi:hypothetical protein